MLGVLEEDFARLPQLLGREPAPEEAAEPATPAPIEEPEVQLGLF
jgi:hypothetical protein